MQSDIKEIKVPILTVSQLDFMCKTKEEAKANLKMLSEFMEKAFDMAVTYDCIDVSGENVNRSRFELIKILD